MEIKQKIIAEIERLKSKLNLDDRHDQGASDYLHAISKFINPLPEEPVSEDLEEASHHFSVELLNDVNFMSTTETLGEKLDKLQNLFKAGAQWQREKIINKACEWLDSNLTQVSSVKKSIIEEIEKATR